VTRSYLGGPVSGIRRFAPGSRLDLGFAILLAIFSFGDWLGGARLGSPILAAAGLAAAEIPAVALAWRSRFEVGLFVIAACCSAAAVLLHATDTGIPILAALYTIALRRGWRPAVVAWGVTCASFDFALAINIGPRDPTTWASYTGIATLLAAAVAMIGLFMSARRAHVQSLVDRNAALERERDLLERERELLAREAIALERARIARELHDVVAHHVSVMVIQAGAAEATLPASAEGTRATLDAIRESGREALVEMRRMLGVLREPAADAEADGTELAPDAREPQPGVAQVPILVARLRDAGVATTLEYAGRVRRLSAAVDVSAYRVVQEALTNIVRHAGRGAAARVSIAFDRDCLTLEVTDDGLGCPEVHPSGRPDPGGHGLVGMRERVALFGGTLETGPVRGAGWRVLARFPIDPVPEAAAAAGHQVPVSGRESQ
jgi:signal transduction histidine kinase